MRKNIAEVQEAPVIDPVARLKEKIDEALKGQVMAAVKEFEERRAKDIDELARLNQILEGLNAKRATVAAEKDGLLKGFFGAGSRGYNDLDIKLRGLEMEKKSLEGQIDAIFSKLTELPKIDFALLNFLSRYERSKP